jgi:hypothetical protein
MSYSVERRFYRLNFPEKERPAFVVGDHSMNVVEVSEGGLRYEPVPGHEPAIGGKLQGRVTFRHAGEFAVTGTVSRMQESTLVIVLERPGLPYAALMEEQRFLMKRYPERFRR